MLDAGKLRGKGAGWRKLRKQKELGFKANFAPLRRAIHRNEFLGSIVELFLTALIGAGKVNFEAKPPAESKEDSKD